MAALRGGGGPDERGTPVGVRHEDSLLPYLLGTERTRSVRTWYFFHRKICQIGSTNNTGVPRSLETDVPQDPTVGRCLGPYGGPRGGGIFF